MTENKQSGDIAALLLFVLIALVCFVASTANAQVKTVDKIEWLTSYETSPIKAYTRDVNNKHELASAFELASKKWNIDIDYLLVIGWSESVFRNLVGDDGKSHGEMQVGVTGRKRCKCDMSTVRTRVDCGACWLSAGRGWCGTLDKGLQAYVGRVRKCKPSIKAMRKYNFKKWLIRLLKAMK